MNTYKYMIIGGGVAGGNAADGIREIDAQGTLALLTEERHYPYQRPPLSKGYLQGTAKIEKVYLHNPEYYTDNRIEVLTQARVTALHPAEHTITLANGEQMGYDKLLLATGGHRWRLPIAGNNLPGVFTLWSIEDSDDIRRMAQPGKRALVLGGSFIGAETAASLTTMGLDVTMVFPETRLLERAVPEELSRFLQDMYKERGVRILTATTPKELIGQSQAERAVLSNSETLDVDLVVMGVGIRLNTRLAKESGLTLTESGAVRVDEMLRTSNGDIYAAGDIAAWPDPTFNTRLRVEHWDVARGQGLQAGRNMAGTPEAYAALPYFFSDMFDFSFEAWGNLAAWDQTLLQGSLETDHFAYYYFKAGRMVGVLAVNPADDVRDEIPHYIQDHRTYADMRAFLRNRTSE